jgi:GntR family transcriptional regulator
MYTQIANHLEDAILSGELKPNQKLPTEAELMKTYDVSRMTARMAVQNLHEKGLVVRKQGKGTFVIDSLLHHDLGTMEAFYDSFKAQDIEAELVEMKVIETPIEVSAHLGDEFKRSLYFKRLYKRKNVVLGFANVYLPEDLSQTVTWHLAEKHSGYSLLSKYSGYELITADLSIRAFPSTEEEAGIINLTPPEPILRLSRTTYTTGNKPIEFLSLVLRSDTCEFKFSVPGNFSIEKGIHTY